MGEAAGTRRSSAPRRRATVTSVLGELLLTAGVVVLLYVVWQLWIGDLILGAEKSAQAAALAQSWETSSPQESPAPTATPAPTQQPETPAEIPVPAQVEPGTPFGVMRVPRFGEGWVFTIAGGVSRAQVLDRGEIGHYPDTAMPGGVGNTAYAAHRWTSAAPFDPIDRLVVGDAIVIETPDGWYTYRFRTLGYVQPTEVDVLQPVPQAPGAGAGGRYLTLTSCAPKFNVLERIVAYAVFEGFTPRAAGPPASLTLPEAA
ncbi:class E sortase [Microbacterium sp.]|uniref:class E sortase n=1 Tax=Microbacterium sp. TaxID=51671 RepID=UPI0039E21FCC